MKISEKWMAAAGFGFVLALVLGCTKETAPAADASRGESSAAGGGAESSPKAGATRTVELPGGVPLELVWCPPGSFTMGSPEGEPGRDWDETPHQVILGQGFWLGRCEVTQAQWIGVMENNFARSKAKDKPVDNVSWEDCQSFLEKAGLGLRLPTEAEWEYACRAGGAEAAPDLDAVAWHAGNAGFATHPVGEKAANAWGFLDMLGNVSEWCADWYGPYPAGPATDSAGPSFGEWRVFRGGSGVEGAANCRAAYRNRDNPGNANLWRGFRVAAGGAELEAALAARAAQPAPAPAASVPEGVKTMTLALPGGAEMEMVWCPPGTFNMGSPEGEKGRGGMFGDYAIPNETLHAVTLTKGFWIARTEVTQEQWQSVMGDNPSGFPGDDMPVESVSWDDCAEFCRNAGNGLQIPTEAQWEYACRAGSTGPFAGTGEADEMGWFVGSGIDLSRKNAFSHTGGTYPVAMRKPNAWGIFDMHGNVNEWCADYYDGDYPPGAATDPAGPARGTRRVVRGGGWDNAAADGRSARRIGSSPDERDVDLGFRPVRLQP
jgi:formylglycine-generating enzyme required for sulfatase activity